MSDPSKPVNGKKVVVGVMVTVIGGFILAVLVAECRDVRQMHDAVIRLEQNSRTTPVPK